MVLTKHFDLEAVFAAEGGAGVFGKVATQLMALHACVTSIEAPVVLECGVHKGWSTGVLAHAVEAKGGTLVSVDIADCSDAIQSERWIFVRSDDSDARYVLSQAPILQDGIDLIYIDSLHAARHVAKLISLWYPRLGQGGWLAFDDVDPGPYMAGRRKDDANREVAWRAIARVVMDFFYANEHDLLLQVHYGSTGLALMQKLAPMDKPFNPPRRLPRRYATLRSLLKWAAGRT